MRPTWWPIAALALLVAQPGVAAEARSLDGGLLPGPAPDLLAVDLEAGAGPLGAINVTGSSEPGIQAGVDESRQQAGPVDWLSSLPFVDNVLPALNIPSAGGNNYFAAEHSPTIAELLQPSQEIPRPTPPATPAGAFPSDWQPGSETRAVLFASADQHAGPVATESPAPPPSASLPDPRPKPMADAAVDARGYDALAVSTGLGGAAGLLLLLKLIGAYSRLSRKDIETSPVRSRLLHAIQESPGIHLRALQRRTGLANGSLVHHLRILEGAGAITMARTEGFSCVFAGSRVSPAARQAMAVLKGRGAKSLLALLLAKPASVATMATGTGLHRTTVRFHCGRFLQAGLIRAVGGHTPQAFEATDLARACADLALDPARPEAQPSLGQGPARSAVACTP